MEPMCLPAANVENASDQKRCLQLTELEARLRALRSMVQAAVRGGRSGATERRHLKPTFPSRSKARITLPSHETENTCTTTRQRLLSTSVLTKMAHLQEEANRLERLLLGATGMKKLLAAYGGSVNENRKRKLSEVEHPFVSSGFSDSAGHSASSSRTTSPSGSRGSSPSRSFESPLDIFAGRGRSSTGSRIWNELDPSLFNGRPGLSARAPDCKRIRLEENDEKEKTAAGPRFLDRVLLNENHSSYKIDLVSYGIFS